MSIKELILDLTRQLGADCKQQELALSKGVLTLASAIIPTVQFLNKDARKTKANLYYAAVAKAGSNKSRVGKLDRFLLPIHQKIRDDEAFRKSMRPSNAPRVPSKNVLVSGNITRARVIEHLVANGEVPLVIIDSEMDSITTSMQVDQGGFRAELRKAYHHEFISSSKKTDDELLEVHSPHLSILVTGTFDQAVKYLFPVTDGFASRHLFDVNMAPSEFSKYEVASKASPELTYSIWSSHFLRMWEYYQNDNVLVTFSQEQIDLLNTMGSGWEEELKEEEADNSTDFLYRHILMVLKVATVLTAFRCYFENTVSESVTCDAEDFSFALEIVQDSYEDAQTLLALMPKSKEYKVEMTEVGTRLYELLPSKFTTAEAYPFGKRCNISDRQTRAYLKRFCALERLTRMGKGLYEKLD